MPEKISKTINSEEDFTQGLDYPAENEAGFDGLMSGENPDYVTKEKFDKNKDDLDLIEDDDGEEKDGDLEQLESEKKSKFLELDIMEKLGAVEWRYLALVDKNLEKLHSLNARFIFLTLSSSVPYGVMLKEAYKAKYGDETVPYFLTVDAKPIRKFTNKNPDVTEEMLWTKLIDDAAEKLQSYGVKNGDVILLMDETEPDWSNYGISSEADLYKYTGNLLLDKRRTIGISREILQKALEKIGIEAKLEFRYIASNRIREKANEGIVGWAQDIGGTGIIKARKCQGKLEKKFSRINLGFLKKAGRWKEDQVKREYERFQFLKLLALDLIRGEQQYAEIKYYFSGLVRALIEINDSELLEKLNHAVWNKRSANVSKIFDRIVETKRRIAEIEGNSDLDPDEKEKEIGEVENKLANFLENGDYFADSLGRES